MLDKFLTVNGGLCQSEEQLINLDCHDVLTHVNTCKRTNWTVYDLFGLQQKKNQDADHKNNWCEIHRIGKLLHLFAQCLLGTKN